MFLFSTITLHIAPLRGAPSSYSYKKARKEDFIQLLIIIFIYVFPRVRSRTLRCYHAVSSIVLNYIVANSIDKILWSLFFVYFLTYSS
jgi:hypothetical protein